MISWWNVEMGPEAAEAAARAVTDRNLSMGKIAAAFELRVAELLGVRHVIAVTNGTSALMLALLEAGVGFGDEVIVPARTWIASAHAPYMLGAKIVFADVEKERPVLGPKAFQQAITPKTKAVVPVHLNGRICDMARIREIASAHGIAVIEDAAQALFCGSPEGGYAGTHSRSGCFSLSVAKLITSGQGGFVVTNDDTVAKRLRLMRTHGTESVIHPAWLMAGGNFRFTDVLAAIAITQLDIYQKRIDALRDVYSYYANAIQNSPDCRLIAQDRDDSVPLYPEVWNNRRDDFMHYLREKGIEARPMYPSLHHAPQFERSAGAFPNAEYWGQTVFIPGGPNRTHEELTTTVAAVNAWTGDQK